MFWKTLALVIAATAIGAAMLGLRQQRLATMHQMVELHRQMEHTRRSMWDTQTQIARQTRPAELRERIERANLKLEPLMPREPSLAASPEQSRSARRGE